MNDEKDFVIDLKSIRTSRTQNTNQVIEEQHKPQISTIELKSESKQNNIIILVILGLLLFAAIAIGWYFLYQNSENYYKGTWNAEVSQSEKDTGIQKLSYDISDNTLVQKTESEVNNIKTNVEVQYDVELIEKRSAGVTYKVKDIKLKSIEINVPEELCSNNPQNCLNIKENYRKSFEEFLNQQKKSLVNSALRLNNSDVGLKIVFVGIGVESKLSR